MPQAASVERIFRENVMAFAMIRIGTDLPLADCGHFDPVKGHPSALSPSDSHKTLASDKSRKWAGKELAPSCFL